MIFGSRDVLAPGGEIPYAKESAKRVGTMHSTSDPPRDPPSEPLISRAAAEGLFTATLSGSALISCTTLQTARPVPPWVRRVRRVGRCA